VPAENEAAVRRRLVRVDVVRFDLVERALELLGLDTVGPQPVELAPDDLLDLVEPRSRSALDRDHEAGRIVLRVVLHVDVARLVRLEEGEIDAGRRPPLRLDRDPLFERLARRDPAEVLLRGGEHLVRVHVADDHEHRVARRVIPPVVVHHVVARDRFDVRLPADDRPAVRALPEGGGHQLLGELHGRNVEVHDPLFEHDAALGIELAGIHAQVHHALRLDLERELPAILREDLVVHRHVLGGERIELSAVALDERRHVALAVLLRALEHHVLEQVTDAGDARSLVAGAHAVRHPAEHDRAESPPLGEDRQSVAELPPLHPHLAHSPSFFPLISVLRISCMKSFTSRNSR
jgi:hypothetical protein